MSSTSRKPYSGLRRKLVLAFDVGTTYSGISYCVLDPGQIPEVKGVTRFPAHEHVSGSSKIPTVLYYDTSGNVCAAGAEAVRDGAYEIAMEEGWVKAEWFKLHIRPSPGDTGNSVVTETIPPLPPGKTVVEVLSDFLRYLRQCAEEYIQDTHANGRDLWASLQSEIDYVISHPNGWEGYQQSQIREAVVLARLIPDTPSGHERVSFVTEGEASLHYSIENGLPDGAMERGDGVVIVDAGGGTVDVSAYRRRTTGGAAATFEEIAAPQCHFHGSVYVSIQARLFLDGYLHESEFHEDLDHIVRCFDNLTKVRFNDDTQPQYIKFGSTRDHDPSCNIRFGQLRLLGSSVAGFFEPSVKCIVDAVQGAMDTGHHPIKHIVLVGGFSASDWLFRKVNEYLAPKGLNVLRPDNHVNKAVSDGAISFYLDHFVRSRVSKVAYGSFCHIPYDETDWEHLQRESTTFMSASNSKRIPGFFQVVLPKNTQVAEEKEFRYPFWYEFESKESLKKVKAEVWCYKGSDPNPKWRDVDKDNYSKLCTVEMDLSHLALTASERRNGQRGQYWYLEYNYILNFSSTELKAAISWTESGVEKRSPARIVYDPNNI